MKIKQKERYTIYGWDFEGLGLFEATINDDKTIRDLRFCPQGSNLGEGLYTTDKKFLRAVYEALKDLFFGVFEEKL